MNVNIGIADNELIFLKSLGTLVNTFQGCQTIVEALNGAELLKKLASMNTHPDILLLDVNMPVMDGPETARNIVKYYPLIKIVALSMKDDDITVLEMLRAGCTAYLAKDVHPDELEKALNEIYTKGYYNSDLVNVNYRRLIVQNNKSSQLKISDRELMFLQLASTDKTYKQIASEMKLSERTIDGYRESLFEKFNVQSRVGMVMEGLRKKLIQI